MNENEINNIKDKNIKIDNLKENIINRVRNVFQSSKNDLQVKQSIKRLLQSDIPTILENYNLKNLDGIISDVIFKSLNSVYNLDKNIDKKNEIFNQCASKSIESKREELVNANNEEVSHELSKVANYLNYGYSKESEEIDKEIKSDEYDYFTYKPEFTREVEKFLAIRGIENQEVVHEIENRVKNTVGNIYENYHNADKMISKNIENICNDELQKYKYEVDKIASKDTNKRDTDTTQKEEDFYRRIIKRCARS